MTPVLLTPTEKHVIDRLRLIKAEAHGRGHGTLRIEITEGRESLVKTEFSEKLTLAR